MKAVIQNMSNMEGDDVARYTQKNFDAIGLALNGNIEFGANIRSSTSVAVFLAAGQIVEVPHSLGRIPQGYIVIKQNAAGSVLTSEQTNPWTGTKIYLNASAAMTATLIIV